MLIGARKALWFFPGYVSVFSIPVDLSVFCRSFRKESNTTTKIYIGHDALFTNEVHIVTKKSVFGNSHNNLI